MTSEVALIGYGEAGSTLARAGGWGDRAAGFDLLASRRAAMSELGVRACGTAVDALSGAPLVLSLVTADQALPAAQDYAAHLAPGTIWCDMNSVAPETKRAAATAIEAAGGRYVDIAVLAPVDPAELAVPLLLAGDAADAAMAQLAALGFSNMRVVSAEIGKASAIKMIRSVMVKGIEALTDEMMAAAGAAGVVDEVLAALDASEKARPWAERVAYNLERMAKHGARRAAEMEESVKTLKALQVDAIMTRGTVLRQRRAAKQSQTSLDANGGRIGAVVSP